MAIIASREQHELENTPEFLAIEEELEQLAFKFKDDPVARDRRKELHAQKRKLVSEELCRCQKLQPRKLHSRGLKPEQVGHHRTQFARTSQLMSPRRRLADDLFAVAPIRSQKGRAVLHDMVELYQQETEVASRPGLEPKKCCCASERNRKIDRCVPLISLTQCIPESEANFPIRTSKPAPQRWRHIYSYYRKRLRANYGFAELCFLCSEWVTSKTKWDEHCQAHLDTPEGIPIQCNPFNYGRGLTSPGLFPFCLGNASLPASVRMQQFLDRLNWQDHVDEHLEKPDDAKLPTCRYPRTQCTEAYPSMQDLKFRLQDVHCVDLRRGCKRSSPDRDADPRPLKTRISGDAQRHDLDLWSAAGIKQEYKFVDEAAKLSTKEVSRFLEV